MGFNGFTGAYCDAVRGEKVHKRSLDRLAPCLFTSFEDDEANWKVNMKSLLLLQLWLSAAAALVSDDPTDTEVTTTTGDIALLPCYTVGNVTPTLTVWLKNGREFARSGGGSSPDPSDPEQHTTVLNDGSLNIHGVTPGDEGRYLCNATLPGSSTLQTRVLLRVTSGPENLSTSIGPGTALTNGTFIVYRGSTIFFNCTSSSYPSQQLTWAFSGASTSNESLVSSSESLLDFRIQDIQPSAQGVYSCRAQNTVSHRAVNKSTELLVYYVPDRHPVCMWEPASDPTHFQFICTWFGAYPTPTLSWDDRGSGGEGQNYATGLTDSLAVTLNRSRLSDGQTLRCTAQHQALPSGKNGSCSFILKPPYPEGEPMVTVQEGTSITLTCTETMSIPPANTTWRRGLLQVAIVPGPKYILSLEGPDLKLTIQNTSKDDEGIYFCRSENPLAVRELEVILTVTNSAAYTGAIIGTFIAALIMGLSVVIAKLIFSNRHQICLGCDVGQEEDNREDVLSLVESDDEHIFQDAVPRLPPLANGSHTTLVQIHQVPSSDHDDAETADTSTEQQEDTVQTEESADLVTF
ncbi:V-set and immunoglobulin domain-containing protein 10 [Antennarius striatus]|uniref:V-set and immunoglobulin domain-containing protein 10 n=1 Tax=Antennarius striatus TaxID=241820 RepID=UPI0035B096EA